MSCCTRWDRQEDPELYDLYARKLLQPGWPGELDRVEFAYIRSQLQQSPSLRRRWGFRPSAKRLSEARIRAVAMHGISGSARGVLASPWGGRRRDLMGRHQDEAEVWIIRYEMSPARGVWLAINRRPWGRAASR